MRFTYRNVKYTLGGKLGDGAVGVVRRATSTGDKVVAVKFLAPDPKYIDPESFDDVAVRFVAEGQRGSRLEHPRLVEVNGYSQNENGADFDGQTPINPYLIMELVHGQTLESYLKSVPNEAKGILDFARDRLFIAIQIADALLYLHHKKIVHRDVKPANIFISGKTSKNNLPLIKLGDFGIVKWGDFHRSLSTGTVTATHQQGLGTMKYMSPEQATDPKHISIKTDIYSFGITAYELLTGEILASPHHVFGIMSARMSRGSAYQRFLSLGHKLEGSESLFCEKLLDCFLRGTDGRPRVDELLGCLSALYTLLYDADWHAEI
jgi:eukaryotic-like serine/threonine-protein kinase